MGKRIIVYEIWAINGRRRRLSGGWVSGKRNERGVGGVVGEVLRFDKIPRESEYLILP